MNIKDTKIYNKKRPYSCKIKIIRKVFFIPFIFSVIFAICSMIHGIEFWNHTYYGLEGFWITIVLEAYGFWWLYLICIIGIIITFILQRKTVN